MGLSPDALARLVKLHLRTKVVVDGLITGLHRSPSRGQSVEFAEHKEYSPGDEIRHIDWKAYGKLDRYYIKRFEQETNLDAYLVVDGSASMGYGEPESKHALAVMLASSLATVLTRQQDRVGLAIWRGSALSFLPPHASPAHLTALNSLLVETEPAGGTDLGALADALAEKIRRRSMIIILSDLFDRQPEGLGRLTALRVRGHDVVVLHLLDRTELEFPFEDPTLFLSMEDEQRLEVNPRELRRGYLEEFGRFLERTERHCRERDCDYLRIQTDVPPESSLASLLGRRMGST